MAVTDDKSQAWILEDDECGHFAVADESEIERYVAIHFAVMHQRTDLIIEGIDFRRLAPVQRCDLCGTIVELPWWEHLADPPIAELDDEYGVWLVCDPCHELLAHRNVDALAARIWATVEETSPGTARSPLAGLLKVSVADKMRLAMRRLDGGRRVEL